MPLTYDPIFAADPNNPGMVAKDAAILIFDPAIPNVAVTITDPTGAPLPNPITVSAAGFGPAFQHATLERVGWTGAGFTGYLTSYEGMKAETAAARTAAQASATAAATAGADAAAAASEALAGAVADAEGAQAAAQAAAALVGAPADSAIAAAVNGTGATKAALNATIAGETKSADALARSQAMAFAARPQPLSRWRMKLATDAANARAGLMGDSTSDPIVEAVAILTRLKTYHTAAGQGLAGMNTANIVSYGHNGTKLADWWGNATHKAEVVGSGCHLLILSFGLNDFRLGATTQAAFRALLIQVVDYLRTNMPTTDIVLRIPNSLTADNTDAFAVGWVSPATPEASQKYSTEMRNAYLSLIGYWADGVAVWDAQGRIFGVTSKNKADMAGLMKDILHPSATVGYPALADALVSDLIGKDAVPAYVAPAASAVVVKPVLDIMGRADSATTPGATTSGHVYEVPFGTMGVSGNKLYLPAATLTRVLVDTGSSNYEVGATYPVVAAGQTIHFRYASSTSFCYLTINGTTHYELFSYAGAANLIGAVSVVPTAGDRIKLQVDGTMCRIYINDVLRNTYTIPATAGTKVGMQATTTVPRWSDFYARPY